MTKCVSNETRGSIKAPVKMSGSQPPTDTWDKIWSKHKVWLTSNLVSTYMFWKIVTNPDSAMRSFENVLFVKMRTLIYVMICIKINM